MYPFGLIGVAPRYIPDCAVSELAGIRLSCTSTPTYTEETQAGGNLSVKSHPGIAPSPSLTNTKHVDPKTPRAKQDFGEFRMQFVGPGF